jgi:hypothetical protein
MAKPRIVGDRYELLRRVLNGNSARGIPELWQATSGGDLHYVRLWPRAGVDDFDLRAIWNREVRSLMRLHAYPGAEQLFARLQDLGVSQDYYYAVLAGGQYQPLSEMLRERNRYNWLQNLGEIGRRRPLWEGILKISQALTVLHAEGTLHRALTPSAIFCSPDGQGNFRLSGFEWTLRLAGSEGGASRVGQRNKLPAPELETSGEYSTATDWFDFGMLCASIFGAPTETSLSRQVIRDTIEKFAYFREAEREILLGLLEDDPELRISNPQTINQALRNIIRDLGAVAAASNRSLTFALRLGENSPLSRAVEKASSGRALADDPEAQRQWVQNDIGSDPRLIGRTLPTPHFVLRGNLLGYKIRPWSMAGLNTWDIGFCEQVETVPNVIPGDQVNGLGMRQVEAVLFPYARRHLTRLRDRSLPWDRAGSVDRRHVELDSHLRDILDFFRITQQLDTVLTVAQICPIEVLDVRSEKDATYVVVTPREDKDRNELAQHLRLSPPSMQLQDWIGLGAEAVVAEDDDEPSLDVYSFLERPIITNDVRPLPSWKFVSAAPHKEGPQYTFRAEASTPVSRRHYYLARNYGGTIRQLRRRHQSIEQLREHESLLRLLADPRAASRQNQSQLPAAQEDIQIDESKANALRRLWQVQPSFAIQGPPGTGKTTLIQAFVDRLFEDDPSAQVLLTAHSHHTVDDVRTKVDRVFAQRAPSEKPIILRLGSEEGAEHSSFTLTTALLHQLADSQLVQRASPHLKDRLRETVSKRGHGPATPDERTMELLVQDAANLTFSTLNDGELADLAGRGRRFDWSIIEEAAKAHGFDMALALQESHRLLLIGDHRQLPPFNATRLKDILGDLLRVRRAIQVGSRFAPSLVDASLVEEEEGRAPLSERCDRWRRMINLFGTIFDASMGELGDERGPAATLNDQHRMHPHIAQLVGNIFYRNDSGISILRSPQETVDRFEAAPPFSLNPDGILPSERIVWLDVPYIQKTEFSEGEKDGLFEAPTEVSAVIGALRSLAPSTGQPCEIQILSPYNDQLKAIKSQIIAKRNTGDLGHMFTEPFDLSQGKRLGATVDEFQGSEADVVIVSLVRNNGLPAWKSVGFLKEPNRMNVLLSRARQKLIVVGSWEFFASRCSETTPADAEYAYLGDMMAEMAAAERAGHLRRVRLYR